jgi:hypothetical protein
MSQLKITSQNCSLCLSVLQLLTHFSILLLLLLLVRSTKPRQSAHYSDIQGSTALPADIQNLSCAKKQFGFALKNFFRPTVFILWKNILVVNSYKEIGFLIFSITNQRF